MTAAQFVVQDLLAVLAEIAPPRLAETWDNVGLQVGEPGLEVSGVLVALDASAAVMAEAARHGCNVLVTHHPLIFEPLRAVRTDQLVGRLVARALLGEMAVVSCHTNLDKVRGGVGDVLAARLGLEESRPLTGPWLQGGDPGFGRIGRLGSPAPFASFMAMLLAALDLTTVRVAGVVPASVSAVAVCGGSGAELAPAAQAAGAEVFITGEVKHSVARWAEDAGFCVIDAGHFATENPVVPALVTAIGAGCAARGFAGSIRGTAGQGSPFQDYFRK